MVRRIRDGADIELYDVILYHSSLEELNTNGEIKYTPHPTFLEFVSESII